MENWVGTLRTQLSDVAVYQPFSSRTIPLLLDAVLEQYSKTSEARALIFSLQSLLGLLPYQASQLFTKL